MSRRPARVLLDSEPPVRVSRQPVPVLKPQEPVSRRETAVRVSAQEPCAGQWEPASQERSRSSPESGEQMQVFPMPLPDRPHGAHWPGSRQHGEAGCLPPAPLPALPDTGRKTSPLPPFLSESRSISAASWAISPVLSCLFNQSAIPVLYEFPASFPVFDAGFRISTRRCCTRPSLSSSSARPQPRPSPPGGGPCLSAGCLPAAHSWTRGCCGRCSICHHQYGYSPA